MTAPTLGALAPVLAIVDGHATTLSTNVAELFGKRHADVLRAIETLLPNLGAEHQRNFALMSSTTDIGNGATRQSPAYRLTRDGFTLLAMGFTGTKALQFKLAYIDAFNRMEAELQQRTATGELSRVLALVDTFAAARTRALAAGMGERLAISVAAGAVAEATGHNLLAAGGVPLRELAAPEPRPQQDRAGQAVRMQRYISMARSYAGDQRYSDALAAGEMPQGKLLGLMKIPARELQALLDEALQAGAIAPAGRGFVVAGGAA